MIHVQNGPIRVFHGFFVGTGLRDFLVKQHIRLGFLHHVLVYVVVDAYEFSQSVLSLLCMYLPDNSMQRSAVLAPAQKLLNERRDGFQLSERHI